MSFIELVTWRVTYRSVKGFIERVYGSRKGYLKRDLRVLGVTRSMKLTPVLPTADFLVFLAINCKTGATVNTVENVRFAGVSE